MKFLQQGYQEMRKCGKPLDQSPERQSLEQRENPFIRLRHRGQGEDWIGERWCWKGRQGRSQKVFLQDMHELGLHSEARGSHRGVLNFTVAPNTTRLLLDFAQFVEGLHFSHMDTTLWSPLEEWWVRTGKNQASSGRSPVRLLQNGL